MSTINIITYFEKFKFFFQHISTNSPSKIQTDWSTFLGCAIKRNSQLLRGTASQSKKIPNTQNHNQIHNFPDHHQLHDMGHSVLYYNYRYLEGYTYNCLLHQDFEDTLSWGAFNDTTAQGYGLLVIIYLIYLWTLAYYYVLKPYAFPGVNRYAWKPTKLAWKKVKYWTFL